MALSFLGGMVPGAGTGNNTHLGLLGKLPNLQSLTGMTGAAPSPSPAPTPTPPAQGGGPTGGINQALQGLRDGAMGLQSHPNRNSLDFLTQAQGFLGQFRQSPFGGLLSPAAWQQVDDNLLERIRMMQMGQMGGGMQPPMQGMGMQPQNYLQHFAGQNPGSPLGSPGMGLGATDWR